MKVALFGKQLDERRLVDTAHESVKTNSLYLAPHLPEKTALLA